MISEGSCDPFSNYAENSALHHRNKIHFEIYSKKAVIFNNNSQDFCFYCIFDQISAALVSRRSSKIIHAVCVLFTAPSGD